MVFQQFRFYAPLTMAAAWWVSAPAHAHHAMGGGTPTTFEQGLISGLAHPVIGVDHLAFILGIGIASAFIGARFLAPLAFVLATLAGCALQIAGVTLPLAEIVVAGSVVLLGALILSGATVSGAVYLALFAVAGLFHGWAYGESIVGAEQTPLVAYLAGFAAIQFVVATGAMLVTRSVWQSASDIPLRIAGGAIAGFGAAFLIENLEKIAFPGVTG